MPGVVAAGREHGGNACGRGDADAGAQVAEVARVLQQDDRRGVRVGQRRGRIDRRPLRERDHAGGRRQGGQLGEDVEGTARASETIRAQTSMALADGEIRGQIVPFDLGFLQLRPWMVQFCVGRLPARHSCAHDTAARGAIRRWRCSRGCTRSSTPCASAPPFWTSPARTSPGWSGWHPSSHPTYPRGCSPSPARSPLTCSPSSPP